MSKPISEKLGIKAGMRTYLINKPTDFSSTVGLPRVDVKPRLTGKFDYIHWFATKQSELQKRFESLRKHLAPKGVLWVSWPKSGQQETDLNIKKVIEIGYENGLVESKGISIDTTWSALKFTHPRDGKVYNNSYGKLKR
jgi:hypothetical protein